LQKLFIDARDGRLDSVRKGLKAADVDVNIPDPTVAALVVMLWDAVEVTEVFTVSTICRQDKQLCVWHA
jgi:hypothetical protein